MRNHVKVVLVDVEIKMLSWSSEHLKRRYEKHETQKMNGMHRRSCI